MICESILKLIERLAKLKTSPLFQLLKCRFVFSPRPNLISGKIAACLQSAHGVNGFL